MYFTWSGGCLVWLFARSVCHLFGQLLISGLVGWLVGVWFGCWFAWLVGFWDGSLVGGFQLEEMMMVWPWPVYPCKETL
jgi:hypothetical protein